MGNPNGINSVTNYPYFITPDAQIVKKVLVPKGTKLIFEEQFLKSGKQNKMLPEKKLKTIELQDGNTINWGGVPVTMINKYFNTEMSGYSVYADFNKLKEEEKTKFSSVWNSCNDDLGVKVANTDDWSFNKNNIIDVESCSVLYQRYFKGDAHQQKFLDYLYYELQSVETK